MLRLHPDGAYCDCAIINQVQGKYTFDYTRPDEISTCVMLSHSWSLSRRLKSTRDANILWRGQVVSP